MTAKLLKGICFQQLHGALRGTEQFNDQIKRRLKMLHILFGDANQQDEMDHPSAPRKGRVIVNNTDKRTLRVTADGMRHRQHVGKHRAGEGLPPKNILDELACHIAVFQTAPA